MGYEQHSIISLNSKLQRCDQVHQHQREGVRKQLMNSETNKVTIISQVCDTLMMNLRENGKQLDYNSLSFADHLIDRK